MALAKAEKALQEAIEKSKQEFETYLILQFEHSSNNGITTTFPTFEAFLIRSQMGPTQLQVTQLFQ